MIDFPTLYPSLVKYLPNWLERFYPSLAQFARGEGYPCGNQGVFIPRRNKCWTHPKTGQRLKKPLTYQMYKDAKEKSQRSRTEKGRTALETREQSFRDKAREKVKGWQKNKEEDVNSRPIPKHPTITETPFTEVNQLLGLRGYSLPDSSDMSKYVLYTAANKVRKDIKSEQDVVDEIKSNPRFNDEMSKLFGIPDTEEKIKLKQQAVDYFDKHSAKWKPIQDQGLREKVNRMTGKPATKSEPKQTPNSTGGKSAIAKSVDQQKEVKPTPKPPVDIPSIDKPIGFEEIRDVSKRLINGDITAKEAKAHYERTKNSEVVVKQDLNKLKREELKQYYGGYVSSTTKKGELVDDIYDSLLTGFNPSGGVAYNPFSKKETYRTALDKAVNENLTDENIQAKASEYKARVEARKAEITKIKKAIDDPQTLEDFELKGKYAKDKTLTPEQQRKYDQLVTDTNKQKKSEELEQKSVVSGVSKEGIKMSLQKTTHAKKGHDLYVATLDERVERNTYDELNSRAKQLGGYYSSYKGLGAIPGFQFRDEETARKFMLLEEVKSDRLEQRKEEQQSNNAERLKQLAERTEESANEKLNQDRLTNTARRASIAGNIENRARGELQLANTLSNIAEATERGELKYLDKVSNKAQVEQLDDLLRQSHYAWARKESKVNNNSRFTDLVDSPITDESIDHAKYPYPSIHKDNALRLANDFKNVPGFKKIAGELSDKWRAIANSETEYQVVFKDEEDIRRLNALVAKATIKKDILKSSSQYSIQDIKESIGNYKRLQGLGITNDSELRTALREYNGLRGGRKQADPTKQLERDLIGVKIPGYFPTPDDLADRLVEQADIKPGMKVLEPSAGKGSLIDAVRRKYSKDDVEVTPIELDSRLNGILKAKGYNPLQEDFMSLKEKDKYDRVVMNPPFENGQDMDHVRHAYDMLKPGGKIVAIMGEGGFFRSDKKSQDFRNWLDDKGYSEQLPAGSFKTSDNPTGVNTRLVSIQKPGEGVKPQSKPRQSELSPDEADILLQVKNRKRKNDFSSNLKLAQFGGNNLRRRKSKQTTCCCNSPNSLRRRKSKQTAKLRRGGNRYV